MKYKLFGALVLALISPGAAYSASGTVVLDWTTFQLNVTDINSTDGITPTLQWIGQTTQINHVVDGIGYLPIDTVAFDWTSSGTDGYTNGDLNLNASFSADRIRVDGEANLPPGGVSRVERWGTFTVTGDARIEASVLALTAVSISDAEMARGGRVYADANLFFGDNTGTALSLVDYVKTDSAGPFGPFDPRQALLRTSIDLAKDAQVYFYTQPGVVIFPAQVPLPAAAWLMGTGLLVLFLRRRSKDHPLGS